MLTNNKYNNYKKRLYFYLGTDKDKLHVKMNEHSINDLNDNDNVSKIYDKPLKDLLIKTNNDKKKFSFIKGDVLITSNQHNWSLSKNRCEENTSAVLLRCLNKDRHWNLYYHKPNDIPFENKKNIVFWRGTTTGIYNESESNCNIGIVSRFVMIEKWYNKRQEIDVGFSFIHRDYFKDKYNCYVKGQCHPRDFLKNKYILSIEGNDKDSGINWKLNSNSLVLMPKPKVASWLMETTLIPEYHYILLKDDFSDLYEKYIWCENNQDKCKEIIKNANTYMKQFEDEYMEKKLEIDVLNKYFELKDNLQVK